MKRQNLNKILMICTKEEEMKKGICKKIFLVVMAALMIFSLFACGNSNGNDNEIVIAYIGALTGEASPFSLPEVNALRMLVDKKNEEGGVLGKQIVLKTYDNRNDNVETVNAAKKAIQTDGASVIIGCSSSGPTLALADVCEEFKIPGVSTTATNSKVTVKDDGTVRPYTFRVGLADPQLAQIMANYACDKMGVETVGILYDISSDYSVGVADNFKEYFESAGGKVIAEEAYKTGDVDFRAQIANLKKANPDALFLPMQYKELGLAAKQARGLGLEQQFLGTDVWIAQDLFNVAGDAMFGSVFNAQVDAEDPALENFNEWYKTVNNEEANNTGLNSYFAYDAFTLITTAIETAGTTDPVELRDAIENTTEIQGLTGPISMDPKTHNPIRGAYIFRVEDRVFTPFDFYMVEE